MRASRRSRATVSIPPPTLRSAGNWPRRATAPSSCSVARTTPEGPLVTASVWHRPVITEEIKDRLAERQARAAVALLRMGKAEEVWPLLRHSADPRLRSFIVNWLNPLGADPQRHRRRTRPASTPASSPTPAEPPTADGRHPLPPRDLDAAGADPGTGDVRHGGALSRRAGAADRQAAGPLPQRPRRGIHGAAEWTLRQWKQQEKLKELRCRVDASSRTGATAAGIVNGQGQTFAVIEGPVEFRMGSPPTEPRSPESTKLSTGGSSPAGSPSPTKEVTVEQYQTLREDQSPVRRSTRATSTRYSPDPDGPMIGVNWYHAAAYCNWLSEQEGLPKDQWCYLPNAEGAYAEGMTIPADVLQRTGYRLPTEAEWEYACRCRCDHQPLLRCLDRPAWQVCLVSGQQPGTRLAVRQPAAQRSGVVRHAGQRV